MRNKLAPVLHPHALPTAILFAGLVATWFAYAPGLSGSLQFDDYHNLGGLAIIGDPASALQFIAGGTAGPLGRPLALASFVPQAYAWPNAPEVFLRTNILIHLLNGLLVAWALYLVGRARRQGEQSAALASAGASVIWLLMPLLASSSLFIVQRMTTLSAFFTLLGMVGYMHARRAVERRPILALVGMTLALGAGASLGALAKENGILIFAFILATEAVLLDRPLKVSRPVWRTWFTLVLIAPVVLLCSYLLSVLPYPEDIVLRRGFSGFERLITQAEILWQYLYLAFFPHVPSLGPFHDDYQIQRSLLHGMTLLSIGAWLIAIIAGVMLRRKAPLFAFAVAWYLLGHLIESTTISLELYYEHRNYLPLVGPAYALVASLTQLANAWRRIALIGVIAYAGILGSVLLSTTSLWGSPALAAEMWHIYKPQSMRAVQNLAVRLEQKGSLAASRRLLDRYIEENPDAHAFQLQALLMSCVIEPDEDYRDEISLLEENLTEAQFDHAIPVSLRQLYALATADRCSGIDRVSAYRLGQSLLGNRRFNVPIIRHNINLLMAEIAIDQKDLGLAMAHIEEALRNSYNLRALNFAINVLNDGGRSDVSRELLAEAQARKAPLHPLRAIQWKKELGQIEDALHASDQSELSEESVSGQ